jgi:hypothetical protein
MRAGGAPEWPGFDSDFAEEPGLIEPYLSAIALRPHLTLWAGLSYLRWLLFNGPYQVSG